ncbi:Protein of unknown function [Reichenbachiella faecimaris]|uniref:DUF5672 domain-containing protein n=1 Tax=Reichenbachiella faecimaris TaxID=692418 RepID=A0A1W2GM66_REIFA|nr:DUF1647 domain-containing protein [Reichenbachiella faecimaris]SMD37753.1 Protein of unknown function [Reichenbachiella faecimaris]
MAKNNTILTAADSTYFRTFCQFLYSFKRQREYENSELILFDLGLTDSQKQLLDQLILKVPNVSVSTFDFSAYPEFVQLRHKTYSFKPIIVKTIFEERKGSLLWLDSATILNQPLNYVWNQIETYGIYAPIGGSGTLKEWTVQDTLDYMKVPESFYLNRNICGCMCGFGHHNSDVRELVSEWERYSLIKECIKPEGANRENHRDDQSLLTILLYKYKESKNIYLTKDEVNISSRYPIDFLSVRNKLNPNFPYNLNGLSIFYFNLRRKIDILAHRIIS